MEGRCLPLQAIEVKEGGEKKKCWRPNENQNIGVRHTLCYRIESSLMGRV